MVIKLVKVLVTGVLLGVLSLPVLAYNPLKLHVAGWSRHGYEPNEWSLPHNETHYNLGMSYGDYSLVFYKNSKHRHTVVFAKDLLRTYWIDTGDHKVSTVILFGVASGYAQGGQPNYAALLKASYNYKNLGVDFHTIPGTVYQISFNYVLDWNYEYMGYKPDLEGWFIEYGQGFPGGQLSIGYNLNDYIALRGSVTRYKRRWVDWWGWSEYGNIIQLRQVEKATAGTYGLNLDYKPFGGKFGVYGGLVYNDLKYETEYVAQSGIDSAGYINIHKHKVEVYPGDRLTGQAEWDKLSYNVGVRCTGSLSGSKWGWYIDLGWQGLSGARGEAQLHSEHLSPEQIETADVYLQEWLDYEASDEKYGKYKGYPYGYIGIKYEF